jgi:rubrerythrin
MEIENWTVKKVLEMGAEMELQSYTMYMKHAENSEYPGASRLLKKLADDELRHRKYFLKALENPDSVEVRTLEEDIPDMKVTDKLINVPLDPKADFPQILKFAAQRESATYDFYSQIAGKYEETELGKLFHNFAVEELNHKKLLEEEYDEIMGY